MKDKLIALSLDIAGEAIDQNLPGSTGASAESGFADWMGSLMSVVMVLAAILVLGFLIFGAIEIITSGGDKSKMENARNKITSAVIGIIVLAATTAIFMIVQNFLGIEIFRF